MNKPDTETNPAWSQLPHPSPNPVVQMIIHNQAGQFLIHHRSANVRSVPNVWSMPAGLHDIGELQEAAVIREAFEECNLTCYEPQLLGIYENITPGPNPWHWVISMYIVSVDSFDCFVNREPEKHDQFKLINYQSLRALHSEWDAWMILHPFDPTFANWITKYRYDISRAISTRIPKHSPELEVLPV